MAMTLVSTVTVGSGGAASIEFTGIAGTGKDLLLKVGSRAVSTNSTFMVRLNGDSGSNYAEIELQGSGSAASSSSVATGTSLTASQSRSSDTASTFGSTELYIANYTSTTNKSISQDGLGENNGTTAFMRMFAQRYSTSSAISSIALTVSGSSFAEHSTASLYIIS
jgi:hypothetical protein